MSTVGSRSGLPRRAVITTIPAAAAASAAVLGTSGCTVQAARAAAPRRFFSEHQAAVVADATARIAPGPADDPAEAGHPGAREAAVAGYIDAMLGALGAPVPPIFAGGPWSNRHAAGPDHMASFLGLDPVTQIAWRGRLADTQQAYASGIATLDRLAGGDFTKAPAAKQDAILASKAASAFTSLLFEHTIEGLYANPEYGGNRGLAGWNDIGFPGDIQPRGYPSDQVERSDGRDPVDDTPIVADVLKFLGAV
ncbi:MAG: gluconate 2-dehydrogenase subunit 3 family protein [Streptosporangiaceae bacterium]|nr:gluconate 2-dehydrogenase subunit 3 family protein [Streptosporangiaceae bacterium]